MATLDEMMMRIRARYAAAAIEDPAAEARILVGGLLGLERIDFIARGDRAIDAADELRIEQAVERRLNGEPPYRILGRRPFFGLELGLSRETLEPRPDTEILVTTVLDHLAGRNDDRLRILDLGTGTGAICLALLTMLPNAHGWGSDISEDALTTARANARANGLASRFDTICSDWFQNISGCFDVIVSNPPYIESNTIPLLAREVREHDPAAALDGGPDGLDAYRKIARKSGYHLEKDGILGLETGFDQRNAVEVIFTEAGFRLLDARKDFGNNHRVQIYGQQTLPKWTQ
jgi:release factor glutamine methyltransferase